MPRRTTSQVAFFNQANFIVSPEKEERSVNFCESCLCCTNKYGLIFAAVGQNLTVLRSSALEPKFDGGDEEQELDNDFIVQTRNFEVKIIMLKLSFDEQYLSVVTTESVYVFHISSFATKANTDAPLHKFELNCESLNFSAAWSPSQGSGESILAVLSVDTILVVSPSKGKLVSHNCVESNVTALAWSLGSVESNTLLLARGNTLCLKKIVPGALETLFEVTDLLKVSGDPRIHHLDWIEPDLIVAGYLKETDEFQPSLCLVRITVGTKSASVVHDAKDAVCSPEKTDTCSHRYTTCYLPKWKILVVTSNCSAECWPVVIADGGAAGGVTMYIEEPDDERYLVMPIDSDYNNSFPIGMTLCLNGTVEVFSMDNYIPSCPWILCLSDSGVLQITSLIDRDLPHHPMVTPQSVPAKPVFTAAAPVAAPVVANTTAAATAPVKKEATFSFGSSTAPAVAAPVPSSGFSLVSAGTSLAAPPAFGSSAVFGASTTSTPPSFSFGGVPTAAQTQAPSSSFSFSQASTTANKVESSKPTGAVAAPAFGSAAVVVPAAVQKIETAILTASQPPQAAPTTSKPTSTTTTAATVGRLTPTPLVSNVTAAPPAKIGDFVSLVPSGVGKPGGDAVDRITAFMLECRTRQKQSRGLNSSFQNEIYGIVELTKAVNKRTFTLWKNNVEELLRDVKQLSAQRVSIKHQLVEVRRVRTSSFSTSATSEEGEGAAGYVRSELDTLTEKGRVALMNRIKQLRSEIERARQNVKSSSKYDNRTQLLTAISQSHQNRERIKLSIEEMEKHISILERDFHSQDRLSHNGAYRVPRDEYLHSEEGPYARSRKSLANAKWEDISSAMRRKISTRSRGTGNNNKTDKLSADKDSQSRLGGGSGVDFYRGSLNRSVISSVQVILYDKVAEEKEQQEAAAAAARLKERREREEQEAAKALQLQQQQQQQQEQQLRLAESSKKKDASSTSSSSSSATASSKTSFSFGAPSAAPAAGAPPAFSFSTAASSTGANAADKPAAGTFNLSGLSLATSDTAEGTKKDTSKTTPSAASSSGSTGIPAATLAAFGLQPKAAAMPPIPTSAPAAFGAKSTAAQPPIPTTAPAAFGDKSTAAQPPIPTTAPAAFGAKSTAAQPPIPSTAPAAFGGAAKPKGDIAVKAPNPGSALAAFGAAPKPSDAAAAQPPIPSAAPAAFGAAVKPKSDPGAQPPIPTSAPAAFGSASKSKSDSAAQPPIPSAAPAAFGAKPKSDAAAQPPIPSAAPAAFGAATKPKGDAAAQPPFPSAAPAAFGAKPKGDAAAQPPIPGSAPAAFGAAVKPKGDNAAQPPIPSAAPAAFGAKAKSDAAAQPPIPSAAPAAFGAKAKSDAAAQPPIPSAAPAAFGAAAKPKNDAAAQPPIPSSAPAAFGAKPTVSAAEKPAAPTLSFGDPSKTTSLSSFGTGSSLFGALSDTSSKPAAASAASPATSTAPSTGFGSNTFGGGGSLFSNKSATTTAAVGGTVTPATPENKPGGSLFTTGGKTATPITFGAGFSFASASSPATEGQTGGADKPNILTPPSKPLFAATPGAFGGGATSGGGGGGAGLSFKSSSPIGAGFSFGNNTTSTAPAAGVATPAASSGLTFGGAKPTTSLFGGGGATAAVAITPSPFGASSGFGSSAASAGSKSLADVEARVRAIYSKHNPEKLSEVPKLMEKYRGNEAQLIENLEKKYGVVGSTPTAAAASPFGTSTGFGASGFGTTAGFGAAAATGSGFGQTSAFGAGAGQSSGFGSSSGFGANSTFGSAPAAGGATATPSFGFGSGFGAAATGGNPPSFGTAAGTSGGFGFGNPPPPGEGGGLFGAGGFDSKATGFGSYRG